MAKTLVHVLCALALVLPWAGQARPLRVVGDNNYPPYLFIGPDGKPQGYVVDEWKLWERKTGIPVELSATNWADAQRRLQQGQADVIEMIFRTPGREAQYDFTPAFAKVRVGIYADRDLTGIADPSGLKGFVVGVQRGDACVERLHRAGIDTQRLYTGYHDLIAAALAGEIRIFCMDEYPAEYYLYRMHAHDAFVKAFDFYTDSFHRGVRRGDRQTLALVERGMARITAEERARLRDRWMGQGVDLAGYTGVFKAVASVLAVVGIALLAWVYSLRRAVKRRTRDLEFLARYDPLTRLPNRQLLLDRVDHAIAQGEAALALLLVDVDNFKRINDSFGHPVGDKLLQEIAERLRALPRPVDTVARLSGDDFVLILRSAELGQVTAVAEQARHEIARSHALAGQEVFVSASVGISLYPHDGTNGVALLKNADAAMARAKQNGRNGISFYRASLSAQASRFVTIGAAIRRALQADEFELVYQPQYCLRTRRVAGVEALVRWRQGGRLVPPSEFIGYAEELGLIDALGEWVLRGACRQLSRWMAEGVPPLRMAVNLSPRQLGSPGLVAMVRQVLAEVDVAPDLLELEITEGALVSSEPEIAIALEALRASGVGIAIDDFGTGYSSLAYLRHLPAGLIKIDKSFLAGVPDEKSAREVVAAIVAMAHALHLGVVAEGVEHEAQADFLARAGCDFAQGWFYGRPMAPERIAALLGSPRQAAR
ncbi:EAL domain-containing protein [Fulvimonas yonginensis]|uniref:EAL domain-containing protein n=1 Tax=Fulvimonas yonginensis TaxID=1495200 RepID=A0ABU8JF51_9GAMM